MKVFKRVTKQEFFASVGQLDVHPRPTRWVPDSNDYHTEWRMRQSGELVGISCGDVFQVEAK